MMKKNKVYPYFEVSTFEDFQIEKDRLLLKRKLIGLRLNYSFLLISNSFSASNFIFSFAKEYVLPKILDFFKGTNKDVKQDVSA
jgi:hypothetical protein